MNYMYHNYKFTFFCVSEQKFRVFIDAFIDAKRHTLHIKNVCYI